MAGIKFACTFATLDPKGKIAARIVAACNVSKYYIRYYICLHHLDINLRVADTKLLTVSLNQLECIFKL